MKELRKTLPLIALLALGGPVWAQATDGEPADEETPAEATGEGTPDPLALSEGTDAGAEGPQLGDIYIDAEFDDWELRCIRAEAEVDPCQLYQLLDDGNDNPVAEINIFPLAGDGPAAGATVITPLETLLTEQLAVSVDGGQAKKYPFSWCSQVGCFARLGFTGDDVSAFKRGISANLTIVPVAAPDQKVNLAVSLKGFTAAFNAATERLASE
ncbi:MAG: invasion associated locus B family protein [Rhodobacter sp.]|nr:invasion associated locus B family protein [Rhodobacter sp.]